MNSGDEPQIPDVFSIGPKTIRAIKAVQHEHKQVRMADAFRALVELRRKHAGFTKRIVATLHIPQCEDCYAQERHQMRADDSTWRPPDISAKTWRKDLADYASENDIRRTYRELKDESRDFPVVHCDSCGQEVIYGQENVYVHARAFEDHFPELVGGEDGEPPRDPPKYVRELVYLAYEGKCAGCGVALAQDEKTMDHIQPKHVGGPGTLENIQLACGTCNGAKKDTKPTEVHIWLDFLLVVQGPEFSSLARLAAL